MRRVVDDARGGRSLASCRQGQPLHPKRGPALPSASTTASIGASGLPGATGRSRRASRRRFDGRPARPDRLRLAARHRPSVALIFPFDPDIRRAATIPSRLYIDPVYARARRRQGLRPHLAARRTRRPGRRVRPLPHRRDRLRGDRRRARRRRRCAASTTSACIAPVRSRRDAASARRCSAATTAGPTASTVELLRAPEMEDAGDFTAARCS